MRNKFDTYYTKKDDVVKEWVQIDAADQSLGRLASQIATVLRGKHKPSYQPSMDNGDFVIVVNASKIKISGRKALEKIYYWYTGFPGGIKNKNFETMQQDSPGKVLQLAVKRMLPEGKMGRAMLKKLFIYQGESHKHSAQKPVKLDLQ